MKTYVQLMKYLIPLCILLFCGLSLYAQSYATGAIFDAAEDQAFKGAYPADFYGVKSDEIPTLVSLRKWASKPRVQGEISSCVGFSCSNAMSIMQAMRDSITDVEQRDEDVHSALYIFNQTRPHGCMGGSRISDAVELLKTKGDCFARQFDEPIDDCDRQPKAEHHEIAAQYRIKDYIAVFDLSHSEERKIHLIKQELAEGKPVITGIQITASMFLMKKGEKIWNPKRANPNPTGGHSVCVVGYNDYNQTFECINSWGEDWADNGFFYAKYEDFAKYCRYGYTLILGEKQADCEATSSLQGDFIFQSPSGYNEDLGSPIFKETHPCFDGTKYVINNWKSSDVYQLAGRAMKKNSYTYIFSIDAANKATLHFPKGINIHKNTGNFSKPIVPNEAAQIIIPGRFAALQSVHKGTDHICILYSKTEIKDIVKRIFAVKNAPNKDFNKRLQEGFADLLIPTEHINYANEYMGFTASSDEGSLVPILLDVIVE